MRTVICDNPGRLYRFEWECRNPEKVMLNRTRQRAKRKGIPFTLELNDIYIPEFCPVLGIKLKYNKGGRPGFFNDSPSLDRICLGKGYIKGNVRVISNRANLLKNDATVKELQLVLRDLKKIKCEP